MHTLRDDSRSKRGSALVFSVVAVMVVSILAAGFLQLALTVTRRLNASSDTLQALNLAEAGLAEAYAGLGAAHTGNVGTAEAPAVFGGGLLWGGATELGSAMVELQCTAMYGTGRATLGMVCESVSSNVASLGFFTADDLRLNPDVRLDSYDSSQGSYADQINTALNNQGLVGSNGDVSIASGDLVFGDVVYGPTGKLDMANGAFLTGGASARPNIEELPPVVVPDVALNPALKYSGGTPLVVPPGETGYSSLAIAKNCKVVLKGPQTFVVGTFALASGAQLLFDTTDGPIEMYVTDTLDMATGSLVSTSTDVTTDVTIQVSAPEGKNINFGAKSQFYGFIYAPDTKVHMASTYELFGGVVCKELSLAAQGKMHCDMSLGSGVLSSIPPMLAWRVVDIPQVAAAQRRDPFQVMGIDPNGLLPPAQSHEDQLLEVRYVNANGGTSDYFGPESDFDWNLVEELLYGLRDGLAFFLPDDYAADIGDDPLLDLVGSTMTSKQLRDALLAGSPGVSAEALIAACKRDPPMTTSDLDAVLDSNNPLPRDVLLAAIASSALNSSTLTGDLIANSPLAPDVLAAVLARIPPLSISDLNNLLTKQ